MPRISHDHKQFYKSKIRSLLAMDHSQSSRELQQNLEENGIHIARNYIDKLRREIDREKMLSVDRMTIGRSLLIVADALTEATRINWNIANNPQSKRGERIAATREIRKAHVDMFNLLFDAGVFDRKLGSIEHTIRNAPLSEEQKVAIRSAFQKWGLTPQESKSDASDDAAGSKN